MPDCRGSSGIKQPSGTLGRMGSMMDKEAVLGTGVVALQLGIINLHFFICETSSVMTQELA